MYSSSDESLMNGKCVGVNSTNYECEDIMRTSECIFNTGIIELDDKCDIYGETCKTKCSELSEEECYSDNRSNDCFRLKESDGSLRSCIDKVLHKYFILFYFNLNQKYKFRKKQVVK
jgi:hypothetical protein